MRREAGDLDERFTAFVRAHGERHRRVAVLLTGDWHAAEDLVQASLVKLYRAWPRLDTGTDPDAYLRRIIVNTHRSWWRVDSGGRSPRRSHHGQMILRGSPTTASYDPTCRFGWS
jgi:DNA-directed RNA polymerase specialized sigma24 family protein